MTQTLFLAIALFTFAAFLRPVAVAVAVAVAIAIAVAITITISVAVLTVVILPFLLLHIVEQNAIVDQAALRENLL